MALAFRSLEGIMSIRRATICLAAAASIAVLAAVPASGQPRTQTVQPYGLNPYAPSDAMWLRTYGAALVAQTPLLELSRLDPYKPSHAALLRQIGGAIPVCCLDWFWAGPALGPLMPAFPDGLTPASAAALPTARSANLAFVTAPSPTAGAAASVAPAVATAAQPGPTSVATLRPPQGNDGVSIQYDSRTWTSAGRAVPLLPSAFQQVGQYAGAPVYKRTGVSDDLIYVPSRDNLIAPFRLKP